MASTAAAPVTRWAREYETIYILRPDVSNDAADKIIERAKDVIARLDGTLTKLDNWGKRKLAYPIQKNSRGIFVYLKYVGFNDLVAELERNLRLLDEVVRFQTVLLEEDIDPASVSVDPEEVQYLHVEEEELTEDAELERARSLGMVPRAPRGAPPSDGPPAAPSPEVSKKPEAAAEGAAAAPSEASDAEAPAEAPAETSKKASAEASPEASADASKEGSAEEPKGAESADPNREEG
jgi:small subunit ribosomal protein S6